MHTSEFGTLVEEIYATTTGAAQWGDVLTRLNRTFAGTHAALFLQDRRTHVATFAAYIWDEAFLASYAAHYAAKNAWLTSAAASSVRQGTIHTGDMMVSDEQLIRTEFYADYLQPQNIHHMIGGCVLERESVIGNVTLLRPRASGSFTDDEIMAFRLVQPHIRRALDLQQRLTGMQSQIAGQKAALDCEPNGVIGIDRTKRVVYMNAVAEVMVRSGAALAVRDGFVVASAPRDADALSALLDGVLQPVIAPRDVRAATMALTKVTGGRSVVLTVRRAAAAGASLSSGGGSAVAALIFLADPNSRSGGVRDVLRDLYSLTPAETRLAEALGRGDSLGDIAAAFGVTENTIRTHMKSIYAKTDTRKQSHLVALLAKLEAAIPRQTH